MNISIENTELAQLGKALDFSDGFALYFVECNVHAYYQPLLEQIQAKCAKPIHTVTVPEGFHGLIDVWLAEKIQNLSSDTVIFVYGLEFLLAAQERDDAAYLLRHDTLQQLNIQRNAYHRMQRSLVFWLPSYALTMITRYALDFFDWRTSVFEFKPPKEQRQFFIQESLQGFGQNWTELLGMSLEEKQRWVGVLKSLITELEYAETDANKLSLAKLLNEQANLYVVLTEYELAETSYKKALEIRENILGNQHSDVATSLNNLAALYKNQGQYAKAQPLYERSLAIWEEVSGEYDPKVAIALNNLALLYDNQGQYHKALPLYKRSLTIWEKALGEHHPHVAQILNNVALLYNNQGHYDKALPLYKRSLAIKEKTLDANHPSLANSLNNLAILYNKQGQYDKALSMLERSLVIREQTLGKHHPDVANSLNSLAGLYDVQGQYDKALPLYKRSVAILKNIFDENHPTLKLVQENYEDCLSALKSQQNNSTNKK